MELERTPHAAITLDPVALMELEGCFSFITGDLCRLAGFDYPEEPPQPDLIVE